MTLVNTETGEILDVSYADVRNSVDLAKARLEEAAEQIVWQIENHVWTVLGHADWNEMREAEYGGAAFMVPREDRPELVTRMRRAGLTQKQIADTAGVSERTVRTDLSTGNSPVETAAIVNARGQSRPAKYTKAEPSDEIDLTDFIKADATVQLTSWRRHFMAAIAKSGSLMVYTPEDVAEKAGVELIGELERLAHDLDNYVSRVQARRPNRLTAIRGGVQ